MNIRNFLLRSGNIERNSYIWNMLGSMLAAFQSVIMLMIITRISGLEDAGIFTIAYANANLFLTIGKFGMRSFQVSDVKGQFSFGDYWRSRVISSAAMIIISVGYVIYMQYVYTYSFRKSMIIIWMCLLKTIDAVEDIFHGHYQKKGRLDVAGKDLTLRLGATIIIFGMCLMLLHDLLISLIIATICSTILFILFTVWTYGDFQITWEKLEWNSIGLLLKLCLPLAIGTFLSFYIGNAPKYAIDKMLTDELQACYGFIAMPVFVIGLLNGFIFNPILYKMSVFWNEGKKKEFVFKIFIQIGIIVLITLVCVLGAYILGIPVLSLLYNTDLAPYKSELLILLLGGGFLGLSGFFQAVNTIIRQQKKMMWGYLAIALLAYLFSDRVVGKYQIFGAAILYAVLMGILCLVFGIILLYKILWSKHGWVEN